METTQQSNSSSKKQPEIDLDIERRMISAMNKTWQTIGEDIYNVAKECGHKVTHKYMIDAIMDASYL